MRGHLRLAALALQVVAPIVPLQAQVTTAARSDSLIPDSRLFVKSDLYVLAGFTAATVAMFPLDRSLASTIRRESLIDSRALQNVEDVLNVIGGPAPVVIGGAMYVVGRVADRPRLAHVALHATEAMIVGLAMAGTLKVLVGRERPYASADTTPHDFGLGRGFKGERYQAFPSGHATVSFAVAAAVLSESEAMSRGARWMVGSLLFASATVVGLSRMYADRHWASDVVMGAAIGTFAGLKTVRFNHTRTGNRVDRWLLGGRATSLRVLPAAPGDWRLAVYVSW
ncbi:MAG: phosphatase PAP2 family protein [Gemmatimonadaceae bacterium]